MTAARACAPLEGAAKACAPLALAGGAMAGKGGMPGKAFDVVAIVAGRAFGGVVGRCEVVVVCSAGACAPPSR